MRCKPESFIEYNGRCWVHDCVMIDGCPECTRELEEYPILRAMRRFRIPETPENYMRFLDTDADESRVPPWLRLDRTSPNSNGNSTRRKHGRRKS